MWWILCSVVLSVQAIYSYEVPKAKVEALYPKGFRVSIPDQEGVKLFAFHGKVNEEMNGREGGVFSRDITKARNGRWTFVEPYEKLNISDILYYWTYVDYFDGKNKLGYTRDDQEFVVKELVDQSGRPVITSQTENKTKTASCKPTETVANKAELCQGNLIFSEDFTSDIQNNKLWRVEQKYADAPDYEFVMYMNRQDTLQTNGGILKIKPLLSEEIFGDGFVTSQNGFDFKERCTDVTGSPACKRRYTGFILPPVVSSQITTKQSFWFKYGKIEIRAKLPKGDWIYPELYLNPLSEEYGPNYESGQMRIAFAPGNSQLNNVLSGGIILGSNVAGRSYGTKTMENQQKSWGDDFHNFTITWKPDSISVSVDNMMYGNIYPPASGLSSLGPYLNVNYPQRWSKGSVLAPFDVPMYITIGVGVGGFNFEDKDDGSKPWRNGERLSVKKFYNAKDKWKSTWNENSLLQIDYVKVWAL